MDPSFQKQNQESPTTGTTPAELNQSVEMNIGMTANIDGGDAEFPAANLGYSMDSSTAAATSPPAKLSWIGRVLFEIKEVGLVIGYLAISFCIIQTYRCATILAKCSENDFLTSYATACVSAALLGKFVFVIEKLPISKRFGSRPLIVAVLYKTALFTILTNILMHIEARFLHGSSSAAANPTPSMADPTAFWLCTFAHQLALLVTFLIFSLFATLAACSAEVACTKCFSCR